MITKKEIELHKRVQEIYKDPRVLLKRVWNSIIPGAPEPTPLQYDMVDFMCINAPSRSILQAFRGCGKSYIGCVALVWSLIKNPTINTMMVSASEDKAGDNAQFIYKILGRLKELNHMLPKAGQRDSTLKFDISMAPPAQSASVFCLGVEGQLEGKRADIILADDIEVLKNSATKDMRTKLLYRANEFESILKAATNYFKPKILMLGTPQTFESVYNELSSKPDYFTRVYPAIKPNAEDVEELYGNNIAPFIINPSIDVGSATSPGHFDELAIERKRANTSKSYFQLHFLLDCTLSDEMKYPLKINDLIVKDVDSEVAPERILWASGKENAIDLPCLGFNRDSFHLPMGNVKTEHVEYEQSIMAIDPSGKGADEMGWAIIKKLYGYIHLIDFGGMQGGFSSNNLQKLSMLAKKYDVQRIVTESNFGGGMFTQLLSPYLARNHPCGIEDTRSSGQKETRIIDILEPLMGQHRLIIDKSAIERENRDTVSNPDFSLIYQMSHLSRDQRSLAHDDRVDALAMACSFVIDSMDIDSEEMRINREFEEMLEEYSDTDGSGSCTWGDHLKQS